MTLKPFYVLPDDEYERLDKAVEEIITLAQMQGTSMKRVLGGAAWMIIRAAEGDIEKARSLAEEVLKELPNLVVKE